MTDDTNAPTEDTAGKRTRGRPTNAELDAREAALKEREAEIAAREREASLAAAEANAALREAELMRVDAARSGEARTRDIRSESITIPLRGRRYRAGDMPNEFHIADSDIPPGMSYQWNNYTVLGQDNPSYNSFMAMQGWTAVPASRHPHLVPAGTKDGDPIIVKGQILMERPAELTREALQEEYNRAIGEVRLKEEQLYGTPQGQLPRARANGDQTGMVEVTRTLEPGAPVAPKYQYENTGGPVVE